MHTKKSTKKNKEKTHQIFQTYPIDELHSSLSVRSTVLILPPGDLGVLDPHLRSFKAFQQLQTSQINAFRQRFKLHTLIASV